MTSKKSPSHKPVLYGVHPVFETLKKGRRRIDEILLARDPSSYGELARFLDGGGCPVTRVSEKEMLAITGSPQHQGIGARVGPFPYADFSEIVAEWTDRENLLIVLDGVQDPVNLGTILRTSECFGMSGVIIARDNAVHVTPAVERASAGASAHVPVAIVVNLARAIEHLKEAGYWVYSTQSDAPETVFSLDLRGSVALVLGSEGKGIRRLVREKCDRTACIPLSGKIGSLNVSQAAAVFMGEFVRQRMLRVQATPKPRDS